MPARSTATPRLVGAERFLRRRRLSATVALSNAERGLTSYSRLVPRGLTAKRHRCANLPGTAKKSEVLSKPRINAELSSRCALSDSSVMFRGLFLFKGWGHKAV